MRPFWPQRALRRRPYLSQPTDAGNLQGHVTADTLDALTLPTGARLAYDIGKNPVVLFQNDWSANYFSETNKGIALFALPVQTSRE